MSACFIDSHCHLFNIEDIPLYPTLGNVRFLPNSLLALAFLCGLHKKELKNFESYINFFDRRPRDNAVILAQQISEALAVHSPLTGRRPVITPLIMDFDEIEGAQKDHVYYQAKRLISEIGDTQFAGDALFLPFVGLDLRKVQAWRLDTLAADFDTFAERCGAEVLRSVQGRVDISGLGNGRPIGIKLYPPIGFNPYSVSDGSPAIARKYRALYTLFCDRNIPVTTHCQPKPGSYSAQDITKKEADAFTHPANWRAVLHALGDRADDFRINFAHFGGEEELKKTVFFNQVEEEYDETPFPMATSMMVPRPKLKKTTWTAILIRLLKTYKNTYADLAAFNYNDHRAVAALGWLLALDEAGELDNRLDIENPVCTLKEKLLWGSDIPMILGTGHGGLITTYDQYFARFVAAMDIGALNGRGSCEVPRAGREVLPDRNELIDLLTWRNPMRFLFDTVV